MTKRFISLFLALALCFSLAISASAATMPADFVVDEYGYLAPEEVAELNQIAYVLYEEIGVGIFFVFTTADSLQDYDVDKLTNGMDDYFIMLENADSWYPIKGGLGETVDTAAEDALRAVYDEAETYVGGVRDYLIAAAEYFLRTTEVPETAAPATEAAPAISGEALLYDEADLLTDSQEAALNQKLAEVSHSYNAQVVIATMASMDGADIDDFVEYLYDTMGFGYGETKDGVLLLVCMDPREYRILSNGFAGVAIDPDDISKISDEIVGNLSDGDYAGAFQEFIDECAYYLDGHLNGFPFNAGKSLAVSLLIGIALGLIVAFVLKGQLNSVQKQTRAHDYVKSGSMHVNISNDIFLYRNVTRTKKQSSSSSSSGGTARSKGGGSF